MRSKPVQINETELVLIPVPPNASDTNLRPNWRPWSFRWSFFAIVLVLHLVQASFAVVVLVAHYSGATGFLSFNSDNAGAYMAWQYAPVAFTIASWMFWEILYIDVCRLEPFYQMTDPEGVELIDSLGNDYLTTFSWFVPVQAFKGQPKRHTAVLLCSIAYIFASNVLPVAIVAMYRIPWEDSGYTLSVAVIPGIVMCVLAILLIINICGVWLLIVLNRRDTGLFGDPAGIGGIAALVSGSDLLAKFQQLRSYDTQARIDEVLGHYRVRLEYKAGHRNPYQICLADPGQQLSVPREKPFEQHRAEAHSWWLWGKTYLLAILIVFGPSLYIQLASRGLVEMNVLAAKICFTISGLVNTGITSNWQINVAMLEPYYRLNEAGSSSSSKPTPSSTPGRAPASAPVPIQGRISAQEYENQRRQRIQRRAQQLADQQAGINRQETVSLMHKSPDVEVQEHSEGQGNSDAAQQKEPITQNTQSGETQQKEHIKGSSSALRLDFISSAVHSMFHAMRTNTKSGMVWYMSLCVLFSQLSVIYGPSMADNAAVLIKAVYDGSITSVSDIPHAISVSIVAATVIGLIIAFFWLIAVIIMMARKRKPFMPRKPYTLSSAILYICNSHGLLEDLSGTSMLSKQERNERLKRSGQTYGMGWIRPEGDEFSHVAIERVEAIKTPFTYKAKLTSIAR